MKLPTAVVRAAEKAGVQVYYADRRTLAVWNKSRMRGDLTRYCGWYWMRVYKGKVIDTDEAGPFRSRMSAIRDAYIKLQLRPDDGRHYHLPEMR